MIVITGASDGLGLALAKLFQAEDKTIVNISRRKSSYANYNIICDLRIGSQIDAAAKKVLTINEPLEALINCAGILSVEPLEAITEEEADRTFATNVTAQALLISRMIKRIKLDGADIVNVSSTTGTRGRPSQLLYGASKWAVRGISVNLQDELKDYSCRVISFCPGGFDSDIFKKIGGEDNSAVKGEVIKTEDMALCLKQVLDLPKIMEVSEIIINRKRAKPQKRI